MVLDGGLAGMIEGLFMLCGVRPAVWGESGGSRVLDRAGLKNVASLRRELQLGVHYVSALSGST